jgi:hypothetical protein
MINNINDIEKNKHYDCLKLDINSEYFIYDSDSKTVNEHFDKFNEMNIDFDYYYITVLNKDSKLINDMKNIHTIKFNLNKQKLIGTDIIIDDYLAFQYIMKTMSLEDYLNLNDINISNKYEYKFLIIHDELPHLDNLKYIKNIAGYEIDCVHLNADSEYFKYYPENNELRETNEINDTRRKINSYILDIDEEFKKLKPGLIITYGDKFKSINTINTISKNQ